MQIKIKLAKSKYCTIVIIKLLMVMDIELSKRFGAKVMKKADR